MDNSTNRKVWIDWMKTLGMLTIIWGHCFPEGMSEFIYSFNVPVFFLISGYLTHRETSIQEFFKKTIHNLVIPYFILALIKAAGYIFAHLSDGQWLWSLVAIVGGFHKLHDAYGCSNLWFVYTLIIVKFVYQLFPDRRLILSCLCLIGSIVYNQYDHDLAWSVVNILLALPFFMLGNYLADRKLFEVTVARIQSESWTLWTILLLSCIATTYLLSHANGSVKLYESHYGSSFPLFALASLTGSAIVFLLAVRFNNFNWKLIHISSIGSIVTLVFHRELLHPLIKYIDSSNIDIITANIMYFISSALILLAFVPIIMIVKHISPIVLGRRVKTI